MTDDDRILPKPIAWAKVTTLVVVACALVTGGAVAVHARQRAALEAKAREAAAEHGRAREARRRACGLAEGAALADTDSVEGACQSEVLRRATTPSLVAFPGMFDEDGVLESPDGCVMTYRSWAAEPDERGVSIRRGYVCTFDPRTGKIAIDPLP